MNRENPLPKIPLGLAVLFVLFVTAYHLTAQGPIQENFPVQKRNLQNREFSPPSSKYREMQIVGLMGDWSLGGKFGRLKNYHDNTWEGVEFVSSGSHECRFVANRSWQVFWGSAPDAPVGSLTGIAVLNGKNIQVTLPKADRWHFIFNDLNGEFSFLPHAGNIAPTANAGPDVTVTIGQTVRFDGSFSYDADGSIASYVWNNGSLKTSPSGRKRPTSPLVGVGMTGPKPTMAFTEEGIHEIILTVTDNQGLTNQDSMRVTVVGEVPWNQDFRSNSIYSVLVTRFSNGDPANDFYCRERIKRDDPHWRGDFKGLIAALDYIRDLGFSAICVNPPIENRGPLDYNGAYGYDWKVMDPRLESKGATYKDFIFAAHSKNLKVIQTVVLNHSCNYGIRNQFWIDRLPHKFYRKSNFTFPWPYEFHFGNYKLPFREDNDNPKAPEWFQDWVKKDPWGGGPFKDPQTGTSLPKPDYNPDRFFGTVEKDLLSDWYHKNGWIAASEVDIATAAQNRHLEQNALDFATENWTVKYFINSAVRQYLDWGVDAIKVEYAGNVDRSQLLTMVNDWKIHRQGLFVFADVEGRGFAMGKLGADKLPSELCPWWYSRVSYNPTNPDSGGNSGLAVQDYALQNIFRTSINNGTLAGIGSHLIWDFAYGDPTSLVTFFHSWSQGPGTERTKKFSGDTWKAALAYTLLWTIRGVPTIIAGEENEFMKGAPLNFTGTSDTLDSTARAYFGDNLSSANIETTKNHPLYKHLRRLNMIRSRIPALQKGEMLQGNEWGTGISFVRDFNAWQSYAVVGIAVGTDQDITVDRIQNGYYIDAVTGNSLQISSATITMPVKANSAGIYVLNGSGKIGEDGPFLR